MSVHTLPFNPNDKILELGGGDNPLYHPNIDIRLLPNVDLVIDFNYCLPIPNDSYKGVFCRYTVEHISWRRIRFFLSEIYRILMLGGKVIIITANLLEQARVLVSSPSDQWCDNYIGMVFGGQDYTENGHMCGFSPEFLTRILKGIGFKDIKILPIYSDFGPTDMIVEATK